MGEATQPHYWLQVPLTLHSESEEQGHVRARGCVESCHPGERTEMHQLFSKVLVKGPEGACQLLGR